MADRSDEPRLTSTPIVPDADNEMMARHRPARVSSSRTRPLWVLCLLSMALLVTMGGYYWLDRQAWQAEQRELRGQLSNLYARIDSFEANRGVSVESLAQQLEGFVSQQQQLQERQEALSASLESLEGRSADGESLENLARQFQSTEEEQESLATILEATQRSLDALEQGGDEARTVLGERIAALESQRSDNRQRYQSLADANTELRSDIAQIADDMEGLRSDNTRYRQRWEQLSSEVSNNRTALTEIRQTQLAIDAALESLRTNIE